MTSSRIPKRVSLIELTARTLRQGIVTRRWRRSLPGERALSGELQVSRGTLRSALAMLARDGVIRIAHGKPCAIADAAQLRRAASAQQTSVGLLSPDPLWKMRPFATLWIDILREQLAASGRELLVHTATKCYAGRGTHALEALVIANPHSQWILLRSTETIQRWFAENAVPAVVAGSVHEEVPLRGVDFDQHGMARHVAGAMIARGHRCLGLISPHPLTAGILRAGTGFRDAVSKSSVGGVAMSVAYHDDAPDAVCRAVDRVLALHRRVTAIHVLHSNAFLTAWSHLVRRGVSVPKDISLVSQEREPYIDRIRPVVSGYQWEPRRFATRIHRLLEENAQAPDRPGQTFIVPPFVAGETLLRL